MKKLIIMGALLMSLLAMSGCEDEDARRQREYEELVRQSDKAYQDMVDAYKPLGWTPPPRFSR